MRILYIHQYFKTPREPGGTRSYWIAKELLKNGHEVTVISSNANISSSMVDINIEGIKVIYLKVSYDQKMSVLKRLGSFVSFMTKSTYYALKQKDLDLVIATSTPLTVGFPALVLKLFKNIPYVFEVRDLWPEVPIQMGAIRSKLLIGLTRWFEKTIYMRASHVIALSPGMADGVEKYIPFDKLSVIPNMSKIDEFYPRHKNENLMTSLGVKKDSFKAIHFGSLGIANGAESIIQSAELLNEQSDIEFLFVGGGSTEEKLKQQCKEQRLTNVHFLGKFPMEKLSEIVNFCDVCLVSFLDIPILYTNSPNKFFDSLSAGKPIIVNSAGWTKDIVEEYNCGFYVNPKDSQQLVDKLVYLKQNPHVVEEMGHCSRELAEKKYDKGILCEEFARIINKQKPNNVS